MHRNNPGRILWLPFLCFCSASAQTPSPGGVSTNLSLWVTAESALPATGGPLTGWREQTNQNRFTLSGTGSTTVTNVINFHPVVRFTGSAKLIGNTTITWSEATTVARWRGNANSERGTIISPTTNGTQVNDAARYFFRSGVESSAFLYSGIGTDSIGFDYTTVPADTATAVYTTSGVGDVFTRNEMNAVVGTLFGGFAKRGTSMTGIPQIGDRSTNDSKMIGDIAEIIIYSANNAAGRNKVESYLALKYGLTLGSPAALVNYTSSAGTVFFTGNPTYQHNIFGVGKDLASGLTQSSSNSINTGSGNGTGQNKMGNLLLTAAALSDQQFLLIGTDSATLNEETITTAMGPSIAVQSTRLTRTWQAQNTNSVGAVSLSFDKTGLTLTGGNTATNYFLMIDNDGDGNFNTGTQTFFEAASVSGNLVNFTPIKLNNNTVFTIITFPISMIPLAVDWESFTATTDGNAATLQWTIGGDGNPDHFVVERSSDDTNFLEAGIVSAGDNPYRFQEQLTPGTWYYRIRMVGKDNNAAYSLIRSVTIAGQPMVQVRPNPAINNQLQLQIYLPQPATAGIRIVDSRGDLLAQKLAFLVGGNNAVQMDLTKIPPGLYFVQVQAGSLNSSVAFAKY